MVCNSSHSYPLCHPRNLLGAALYLSSRSGNHSSPLSDRVTTTNESQQPSIGVGEGGRWGPSLSSGSSDVARHHHWGSASPPWVVMAMQITTIKRGHKCLACSRLGQQALGSGSAGVAALTTTATKFPTLLFHLLNANHAKHVHVCSSLRA